MEYSLQDIANSQKVTYEAIRRQVARYSDPLKGHIRKQGRKQYIDQWGFDFLKERRKENPVVVTQYEKESKLEELQAQVELLKGELVKSQEQIIEMLKQNQSAIETKVKYDLLLAENTQNKEELQALRKNVEEQKEDLIRLQYDRDQYKQEAESYQKSIFGFYRKIH